jgi:hypothetical protein
MEGLHGYFGAKRWNATCAVNLPHAGREPRPPSLSAWMLVGIRRAAQGRPRSSQQRALIRRDEGVGVEVASLPTQELLQVDVQSRLKGADRDGAGADPATDVR